MTSEVEEVKRLEPTKDTIRELFVKSGNECAFPGCGHRIINQEGVFIAQICHIEAAETGGQRFNAGKTNEDRRHVSNLMLMCHAHHKITDDVKLYPVSALQEMKRKHEAKYTDAVETIYKSIVDEATKSAPAKPVSLGRFNGVIGTPTDEPSNAPLVREISDLVSRLHRVPRPTRELLVAIVRRCETASYGTGFAEMPFIELIHACNLKRGEACQQLVVLEKYGVARLDPDTEKRIQLRCIGESGDWDFWSDLRAFCEKTAHTLEEFIIEFRFDLLD